MQPFTSFLVWPDVAYLSSHFTAKILCAFCRVDSAVLDLVADDSVGLQKQKSIYHWDKVFIIKKNLI